MTNPTGSMEALLVELLAVRFDAGLVTSPENFLMLRNSAQARTAAVFQDHMQRPIGYLIWADVNKESAARLMRNGTAPLYFYEWNEGDICLLLDVVILPHGSAAAVGQLLSLLKARRAVLRCRRHRSKLYFKNALRLSRAQSAPLKAAT